MDTLYCAGMSLDDFIIKHAGGVAFDIEKLSEEFKKHCPDYGEQLSIDTTSKAVEFCEKIIYEVEPWSRKIKNGTQNKIWKFRFKHNEVEEHFVFVVRFRQENYPQYIPKNDNNTMILTVKEAGLLAQNTFSQVIKLLYAKSTVLMTPLAAALFSKDNVVALAKDLGITEVELLIRINCSTQSGGEYLENSDIDIALCATMSINRNVKDENKRKSIIVKTYKKYVARGATANRNRIQCIAKYVTGGIPADFSI